MTPTRLKDIRWDLESIDWQGITLNQPRFRIESINYNTPTLTALVEIRFRENQGAANFEHSQVYPYTLSGDSQESISAENVENFISAVFPNAIKVE
jgi:hypothetical protein